MAAPEISESRRHARLTGDESRRIYRDISHEACDEQPRHCFFLRLLASLGDKLANERSRARLVPALMATAAAASARRLPEVE